uniref:FAR1 domain-containing protein n=1 Tax=Kalanchoe fedtschenkoi TaxID=63787 RepID=A0A7N0ZXH5_KALFE
MESDAFTPALAEEEEEVAAQQWEPLVGMEFDSEEAAKLFYGRYAQRMGFVVRVMACWRSEKDGRIIARRFGCNREGHKRPNKKLGIKPKKSFRGGCKAMVRVKCDRSGKWVITNFVSEHNHPLEDSNCDSRKEMDDKDLKIRELTRELNNKKRQCQFYKDQLDAIMNEVEKHVDELGKKADIAAINIMEFESKKHKVLD